MFTKWQASHGQFRCKQPVKHDQSAKVRPVMGLFKPDLYRYLAIGFAVGALFVVSSKDSSVGERIAHGVVPVAEAQAAK